MRNEYLPTAARNAVAEADYRGWTMRLFADAGIDTLLVDEGVARRRITLGEPGSIAPVRIRRVARSDNFIRDLLPAHDTWAGFYQGYQAALDEANGHGAIAPKPSVWHTCGGASTESRLRDRRSDGCLLRSAGC